MSPGVRETRRVEVGIKFGDLITKGGGSTGSVETVFLLVGQSGQG